MSKIVSFINMKGGVGKTTSSVTLAETCAAEFGWKVLVVDLDAQASASYALCGAGGFEDAVRSERTLAAFFDRVADGRRPEPLSEYRTRSGGGDAEARTALGAEAGSIDVLCSEPSLRYAERALIEHYHTLRSKRRATVSKAGPEGQTRRIMRDSLDRLKTAYDLIVIDCPPGISIFAEAGVSCSDLIVMPTIPDYLSTLGLKELNKRFLRQLRRDGNLTGRMAILPTKVRPSDATHKRFLKHLDQLVRDGAVEASFLTTLIGENANIARALEPEHLGEAFKDKYAAVKTDLVAFAEEIRELLEQGDAVAQKSLSAARKSAADEATEPADAGKAAAKKEPSDDQPARPRRKRGVRAA
ncbi:MAG: AAA family ATPase [Pseudomonadota bacterium]